MPIILTGFEPFGKERYNPSGEVAKALNGKRICGETIVGVVLPVAYRRTISLVEKMMEELKPSVFLGTGLAPSSPVIRIERIAVNLMDFRKPDNDGDKPVDVPIYEDGPLAYMATIPTRDILIRLREAGIPASLSYSAGTYLCNLVFYAALHNTVRLGLNTKVGFVHLPYELRQAAEKDVAPSLPFDVMLKVVEISLRVTLEELDRSLVATKRT
ncbi:MAG: pyroglutamyl-peptidase I [Thermoprotei archaeon]|nr:pyroglutamyl-peptidase I [Thermoprotei archaeon]